MNKLNVEKRAQVLHRIVEGNSLRATARLTDAALNTVVIEARIADHVWTMQEIVALLDS